MSGNPQEVSVFFECWFSEFARSVEMFTGEVPTSDCKSISVTELTSGEKNSYLWWKQIFAVGDPASAKIATAWFGAPEPTWSALGASLGTEANEARNTYLEIVRQSVAGAAHVLGGELQTKISCGEGVVVDAPVFGDWEAVKVIIELQGKELPGIVATIDTTLTQEMETDKSDPVQAQAPAVPERALPGIQQTSILDSVIDLNLGFSVVLGRASLPIRDVLKLTAGSLIELDHFVNEPVEMVIRGAVVAYCDIVQVRGNYGIRIQKIISPEDRMNLKGYLEKARIALK